MNPKKVPFALTMQIFLVALFVAIGSGVPASAAGLEPDAYGRSVITPEEVENPAWFPDGNQFVFLRSVSDRDYEGPPAPMGDVIMKMDAKTGEKTVLVAPRSPEGLIGLKLGGKFKAFSYESPKVSPDGRYLAFTEIAKYFWYVEGAPVYRTMLDRGQNPFSPEGANRDIAARTFILDLQTGIKWNLTSALGLKGTRWFHWAGDSSHGLIHSCPLKTLSYGRTSERTFFCEPRKITFTIGRTGGVVKLEDMYTTVSPNGRFALFKLKNSPNYVVRDTRSGKVQGSLSGFGYEHLSGDGQTIWTSLATKSGVNQISVANGRVMKSLKTRSILAFKMDDSAALVRTFEGIVDIPTPDLALPDLIHCPEKRESDPVRYDYCWEGFQLPTISPVTVMSCYVYSDPRSSTGRAAFWKLRFEMKGGVFRRSTFKEVENSRPWEVYPGDQVVLFGETRLRFFARAGTDGYRDEEISWNISFPKIPCLDHP